jgi:phospholipid transport system substrate-binding protein
MSTRRLLLAAGLALVGWTLAPTVQASADPQAFIQEVSSKAITEMAPAATETDKERAAKLKPLLEQYFDMPAIAKYMLGSYWPKATPEEQTEFTATVTDFLALAYGKRFASYTGHEMAVGRVRDEGDGRTTVFSTVKLPSGDPARGRLDHRGRRRQLQDRRREGRRPQPRRHPPPGIRLRHQQQRRQRQQADRDPEKEGRELNLRLR